VRVQIRYVHEAYDNNRHKQIQTVGSDTTTAETNRQTQSDQHQVTEGVERMTKAEIADSDRPKLTHRREVVGRGEDNNRHTDTDIQTNINSLWEHMTTETDTERLIGGRE